MKHEETARRLTTAMANAGMKAVELAERSGVSKSSISQYMSGMHAPSNLSSGKMAAVLGVNPVWLMGFDAPMTESFSDLTSDEINLLYAYRSLDQSGKDVVKSLLDSLEKKTNRMEGDVNVG